MKSRLKKILRRLCHEERVGKLALLRAATPLGGGRPGLAGLAAGAAVGASAPAVGAARILALVDGLGHGISPFFTQYRITRSPKSLNDRKH